MNYKAVTDCFVDELALVCTYFYISIFCLVKLRPFTETKPLTDYDKTLHNWLRPGVEHVTKICVNRPWGSVWRNTWNTRPLLFYSGLFLPGLTYFSHPRRTIAQNTRCDVRKCRFVSTRWPTHFGVQKPKKPSKMAFYKHVLASANGLEKNDVEADIA